MANQAVTANPLFGRPQWTYVNVLSGPVRGPQPRLAQGTGRTGAPAPAGQAAALPGYVSSNDYQPSEFGYSPANRADFLVRIPRGINFGNNGRELVGTYQPHDNTQADRFNHQMRSAPNWQKMEYPPAYRNLLAWQQVQRYRVNNVIAQARPLASADYFLGYQVSSQVQGRIGQSTLGNLGSG